MGNLPPTGLPEFAIKRPEIYYGELTRWYVLADSREPEVDYDNDVTSHYHGTGGIPVGGFLRRAALAWYLSDPNLLISHAVTSRTRLMLARDVEARVHRLAPFLAAERDPYLVISHGRLYWIVDMYTTTSRFPYSHHEHGINYIRNSVKAIVDAYNGSVTLAVVDPSDPILHTYRSAFPSLFTPVSKIDPDLRAHFRYPKALLRLQAEVYNAYHVKQATVFYNKQDLWQLARETVRGQAGQVVNPYYAVMELPGTSHAEFILMVPFTPSGKDNMVAWLAARCDPGHYGQLVLYRFPKDRLVYGPQQIEARIDQNTTISQQLTLWNQRGSAVVRGTLLIIPIDGALLYVEPLYLQGSDGAPIPEMKRVILATSTPDENKSVVVMRPTFRQALDAAVGAAAAAPQKPTAPSPTETPAEPTPQSPPSSPATSQQARQALDHMHRAEQAAGKGDWSRFGQEMKQTQTILRRMAKPAGHHPQQE